VNASRPAGRPVRWRVGDVIDDRYEVTDVHEDGGMGVVYRVRHRSWATELAVKSPRPEVYAADRDSFVAEAEAWVSLGLHPNVCGCHYVRLFGDVPLVFAEYVPGGSLRKWIEDGRLYRGDASARVLDLAIQTARGLEHAHASGLVHQDVKPANVLLDDDGTAKVTDFGLAKARAVGGARPATEPSSAADVSVLVSAGGLTPAYASPEQAMGRPLSRRTDIYSFAVSVLEMYTGGLTWMSGLAAGHVLAALRTDGPGRPGPPPLPDALAELLEHCLRRDPAERPGSMAEVAEAIARIYRDTTGGDHPRPVPVAAELRADELNNRALSLMDLGRAEEAEAAFTAALSADPRHLQATYNSGLLRWRRGAITDLDLLTDLTALLPPSGPAWEVRHLIAQTHLERGDLRRAGRFIAEALLERPGEPELTAAERVHRSGRLIDARVIETRLIPWYVWDQSEVEFEPGWFIPRGAPGISIPFSADGSLALSSCDGVVRRWDLRSGAGEEPMTGIEGDIDLDASGRHALSGHNGELRLWDLAERRLLGSAKVPEGWSEQNLIKVRLNADATVAIASVGRGRVVVWNIATGELRHLFDGHFTQAPIELGDDGSLVLSPNDEDRTIRLFETATGRCLLEIPGRRSGVMALRIRADNRVAAISTYDHVIDLWDLDGKRVIRSLTGPSDGYTNRIELSEDGRLAVTGGIDHFGSTADGPDRNSVRIWDLRAGRVLRTFAQAHFGAIRGVRLDGDQALSVGKDGFGRWSLPREYSAAWQLSRPRRHGQIDEAAREVAALVEQAGATADRRAALALLTRARAVPGHERSPAVLSAWNALGRSMPRVGVRGTWPVRTLTGHTAQVFSVAVSADGRTAVSGGIDRAVRIWDLETGACRHVLPQQPSSVDNVGVSADGARALSASRDGVVAVWSTETGERLHEIDGGRTLGASPACFSADGRLALIGTATASVQLWDLTAGECVRMVETGIAGRGASAVWMDASGSVAAVAGGDDTVRLWDLGSGSVAAVAGGDDTVRLWDLGSGELLSVLKGHSGPVRPVRMSAGGERALTVAGGVMRLFDAASGECLRVFADTPASIDTVCFSPDGRFALTGGKDRAVRIWSVDNGRCLGAMEGHQAAVSGLTMTRDGRFALSAGDDRTVRIWELDWVLAPGAGDA